VYFNMADDSGGRAV